MMFQELSHNHALIQVVHLVIVDIWFKCQL